MEFKLIGIVILTIEIVMNLLDLGKILLFQANSTLLLHL